MKRKVTILILVMVLLLPSVLFADIDTLWTKAYDVDNGVGYSLVEVADGGYLIIGYHDYISGPYVIRTDTNGDTIWTRDYDFWGEVIGTEIIDIGDNNYVISSYKIESLNADMALMQINGIGDTIWTSYYDFGGDDVAHSVCKTRDGGYLIAGETSSFDAIGFDVFLVKTDSVGEVQGTYLYKSDGTYDAAYGVDTTADGGYIVACESDSASLLRFDSQGNLLWRLGGNGSSFYAVKTLVNGDYIAAGTSNNLMKVSLVNDNGYAYNSRYYGLSGDYYYTTGYGLDITSDGGYILAGVVSGYIFNDRVYIVKIDSYLNSLWSRVYGTDADWKYSAARSIKETSDGDYIAVGYRDEGLWLLKLGEVQNIIPDDSTNIPNNYITLTSYPNPFNSETTIKFKIPSGSDNGIVDGDNISKPQRVKLSIYDLFGRKIAQLIDNNLTPGEHSITWNAKNLPSGIYFYRLSSNNKSITKKMVLLK